MNYTYILKTAGFTQIPKQFVKSSLKNPMHGKNLMRLAAVYEPITGALKGDFSNIKFASLSGKALNALEKAELHLSKAQRPGAWLEAGANAVKGLTGLALLGTSAYLMGKSIAPEFAKVDIDKLYNKLRTLEPNITNYSENKAKEYLQVLLEHNKELMNKPRILSAILVRVLPYPTFPYENLDKITKVIGTSEQASTVSALSKGLSAAGNLM